MDNPLRQQIYNHLNEKETDDLLAIWQRHDTDEWQPEAFDVIAQLLTERLGELPDRSDQDEAEQHLERAERLLQAGSLRPALDACERAIQLAPEQAEAYLTRGLIYDELDEPEKALADYRQALRLDPALTEAVDYIRSAEKDLQAAFEESPVRQRLERALELALDGETRPALEEIQRTRPELPAIAPAYNYLGMLYEQLEQLEPAIDAYLEAIRLNPQCYPARANLANARLNLEAERYRLAATAAESLPEAEEPATWEFDDAQPAETVDSGEPIPGWMYLDEKSYVLPGWPGHRNLRSYSGYDPLKTSFEEAHLDGVIVRRLLDRRFRTHNPVFLLLMVFVGLVMCTPLPLAVLVLARGEFQMLIFMLLHSPYLIAGVALFVNVALSLVAEKPASAEESGMEFF